MSIDVNALINFVVSKSEYLREGARVWTQAEEDFLRANVGYLTDAEMGQAIGRTAAAVKIRRVRVLGLPGMSRAPHLITARRAADLLGIDMHKTAAWVDMGLLPGWIMAVAGTKYHNIHLIERTALRRWVLNPMNWVYFKPENVRDLELRRMLRKRAARWGDEWWTTRQVADYHRVDIKVVNQQIRRGTLPSFRLPVSLSGRHPERVWSNHFVRKSDALRAVFLKGKGAAKKLPRFTPTADAWILKARDELGMSFVAIGRTMKVGQERDRNNSTIAHRYRQLKALQLKTRKSKKRGC